MKTRLIPFVLMFSILSLSLGSCNLQESPQNSKSIEETEAFKLALQTYDAILKEADEMKLESVDLPANLTKEALDSIKSQSHSQMIAFNSYVEGKGLTPEEKEAEKKHFFGAAELEWREKVAVQSAHLSELREAFLMHLADLRRQYPDLKLDDIKHLIEAHSVTLKTSK